MNKLKLLLHLAIIFVIVIFHASCKVNNTQKQVEQSDFDRNKIRLTVSAERAVLLYDLGFEIHSLGLSKRLIENHEMDWDFKPAKERMENYLDLLEIQIFEVDFAVDFFKEVEVQLNYYWEIEFLRLGWKSSVVFSWGIMIIGMNEDETEAMSQLKVELPEYIYQLEDALLSFGIKEKKIEKLNITKMATPREYETLDSYSKRMEKVDSKIKRLILSLYL